MRKSHMHRAVFALVLGLLLLMACTRGTLTSHDFVCPKIKGYVKLNESQKVMVTQIADGDTFTACLKPSLNGSVRIRVLGIDCPESKANAKCKEDEKNGRGKCALQIPAGKKATLIAKKLLQNTTVSLESARKDGTFERDIYGRILAYVRLSTGEDYGKSMIRDAQCENYHWKYPHPRGIEYSDKRINHGHI